MKLYCILPLGTGNCDVSNLQRNILWAQEQRPSWSWKILAHKSDAARLDLPDKATLEEHIFEGPLDALQTRLMAEICGISANPAHPNLVSCILHHRVVITGKVLAMIDMADKVDGADVHLMTGDSAPDTSAICLRPAAIEGRCGPVLSKVLMNPRLESFEVLILSRVMPVFRRCGVDVCFTS